MTTPAENRKTWAAALRSGKYLQGKNTLHMIDAEGNDRFCCLGVACELAVAAGIIAPAEPLDQPARADGSRVLLYDGEGGILPTRVCQWLGLPDPRGLTSYSPRASLTALNDEEDWTFEQIAELIDAEQVDLTRDTTLVYD